MLPVLLPRNQDLNSLAQEVTIQKLDSEGKAGIMRMRLDRPFTAAWPSAGREAGSRRGFDVPRESVTSTSGAYQECMSSVCLDRQHQPTARER